MSEWRTLKECICLVSQIASPHKSTSMSLSLPLVMLMKPMRFWQSGQCVPSYKNMHALVDGCTTCYISILWNVLGILLSGTIVTLEKHPVFLDCHRLALRRASSSKTFATMLYDSFQCSSVWNEDWKPLVSLTVELVLDVSIVKSPVSYHNKILECAHGMLAQWKVNQMRWLK